MTEENVEIVRSGYRLYEAGDFDGVALLFAENAEMPDAGGLGVGGTAAGTRRGPEGFRQATDDALEAFEDYRVIAEDFIDAGDAVIVPVLITGRGRVSAAQLEMRLAHLWFVQDGKVIRGEVHRTVEEAIQAAELSE
jgi:ketosteroid isomerase-like protein